jgi:hypothetical protein
MYRYVPDNILNSTEPVPHTGDSTVDDHSRAGHFSFSDFRRSKDIFHLAITAGQCPYMPALSPGIMYRGVLFV